VCLCEEATSARVGTSGWKNDGGAQDWTAQGDIDMPLQVELALDLSSSERAGALGNVSKI